MQAIAHSHSIDALAESTHTQGVLGVAYDPAPPSFPSIQPVKEKEERLRLPSKATFDPSIHLCFSPPSRTYTFKDLGLDGSGAIAEIAASEAFPLFTKEAVLELRKDALSSVVHDNFAQ